MDNTITIHSVHSNILELGSHAHEHRRIILVEDDVALRRALRRHLIEWGYVVNEAGTVDEAKTIVSDGDPISLVLSDYHLPDGTGLELLQWLSIERHLEPPFVLMSGEYLSTRNVLGDFLFLPKPFSLEQLQDLLEQSYALHSARGGCSISHR